MDRRLVHRLSDHQMQLSTNLRRLDLLILVCAISFLIVACRDTSETVEPTLVSTSTPVVSVVPVPTASPTATKTAVAEVSPEPTATNQPATRLNRIIPISVDEARSFGCAIRESFNGRRQFGTAPAPTPVPLSPEEGDLRLSEPVMRYVFGLYTVIENLQNISQQAKDLNGRNLSSTEIASFASDLSKRVSYLCDAVTNLDRPETDFLADVDVKSPLFGFASFSDNLIRSVQQHGSLSSTELAEQFLTAESSLDELYLVLDALEVMEPTGSDTKQLRAADGSSFELFWPSTWVTVIGANSIVTAPPSDESATLGALHGPSDWPVLDGVRVRYRRVPEGASFENLSEIYAEAGRSFGEVGPINIIERDGREFGQVDVAEYDDHWSYKLLLALDGPHMFTIELACVTDGDTYSGMIDQVFDSFRFTTNN
jgi:hypothetical protein